MRSITVIFGEAAWQGHMDGELLYFDFATTSGRPIRFIALHDKCIMFAHRFWPGDSSLHVEWLVHIVDIVERDPGRSIWQIIDREIDITIEENLQTYRLLDLEDFGEAIAEHRIASDDAYRLLRLTQEFLDTYLHGGPKFPPREALSLLEEAPTPQPIDMDLSPFL
jgi:hypothetical protein